MAKNLEALRVAPITEPFDGPAILSGRASAVFFHEVLGHRLEGQRQRGDDEGQTFTKLLGKPILPTFLSVADDPTLATFHGTSLSGHYDYDDEGQPARRVELIKDGVLNTFLMSRLPVASVSQIQRPRPRRSPATCPPAARATSSSPPPRPSPTPSSATCSSTKPRSQGKPYGLYFEDISSGFAVTTRRSPQAFQVIPLVVYRVYVDGRPDELVRGVTIVGTPQAALNASSPPAITRTSSTASAAPSPAPSPSPPSPPPCWSARSKPSARPREHPARPSSRRPARTSRHRKEQTNMLLNKIHQ